MMCSICGRKLSNPKSIELGYGPVCYGKVSGSSKAGKKAGKSKKSNLGISHQEQQSACYDIPGQMELQDYLADL